MTDDIRAEISYHKSSRPSIKWNHIDGPILSLRHGGIHWLTLIERFRFWLGLETVESLERKHWND